MKTFCRNMMFLTGVTLAGAAMANPAMVGDIFREAAAASERAINGESNSGAKSAGVSKQGNAASCFSDSLIKKGNRLEFVYRTTSGFGGPPIESETILFVTGNSKFKGKKAIEVESESTTTESGISSTGISTSYFQVDKSKKHVTNIGGFAEVYSDGQLQGTSEIRYKPGQLFRYDLKPGQSYVSRYKITSKTETPQGTFKDTIKNKVKTKFLGVENVRVPAGKFKACKFKATVTTTQQGFDFSSERTYWQATKTGLEVKSMGGGSKTVLVSGTLNDKKL